MARKKMTGWDRQVTIAGDGRAVWSTGEMSWAWSGGTGINLTVTIAGESHRLCYAGSLANAGYIAEGFEYAWQTRDRMAAWQA